jgi:hypothetical protein
MEVMQGYQSKNLGAFSQILREITTEARPRGGISFRHEGLISFLGCQLVYLLVDYLVLKPALRVKLSFNGS